MYTVYLIFSIQVSERVFSSTTLHVEQTYIHLDTGKFPGRI
jgi:hypothetical protein